MRSDSFDGAHRPQQITLELDLDGAAGVGPTVFHEGFESGDLGTFASLDVKSGVLSAEIRKLERGGESAPHGIDEVLIEP